MCTILLEPETRQAEKRSREDSQKAVDELMERERELLEAKREYERQMAAPFNEDELKELLKRESEPAAKKYPLLLTDTEEQREAAARSKAGTAEKIDNLIHYRFRSDDDILSPRELGEQFEKHEGWGSAHGWEDYRVLSDEEKKIVDGLGLTPPEKKCEPLSEEESKCRLYQFRRCSRIGSEIRLVMRYDCRRGEFAGSSFYYLAVGNGFMSAGAETPEFDALKAELGTKSDDLTKRWLLVLKRNPVVVEKKKLRPYQISFLETLCAETEKSFPDFHLTQVCIRDRKEEERQKLWRHFQLLTEEEKRLAGKLGLTPQKPRKPGDPDSIFSFFLEKDCKTDGDRRRKMKARLHERPSFGSYDEDGSGRVYVWLDNCCFGNSRKKGFYYVRFQLSMLSHGSTAYSHPVLIVQKNKLRPDQVEYMERKCEETYAAARAMRNAGSIS